MAKNDSDILSWMKLDKDFPSKYKIRALINQKASGRGLNGYEMFTIFFLMLCESIPHGGELRYSKDKPYDMKLLADVLCLSKNDVESTCKVLQDLEILEQKSDGTLRFSCVEENICSTTKGAERLRNLRKRERLVGSNEPDCSQNEPKTNPICTQEYKENKSIRDKDIKRELNVPLNPQTQGEADSADSDDDEGHDAEDSKHLPDRSFMTCCAMQRGISIEFLNQFIRAVRAADYKYPVRDGKLVSVNRSNFTIYLQAAWNDASVARTKAIKMEGFVPPSEDEVKDYFRQMGYTRDPAEFWLYYQGRGWKTGQTLISDWKAVAASWERRGLEEFSSSIKPKGTRNGTRRETRRGDPNSRNPEHTCYSDILAAKGLA